MLTLIVCWCVAVAWIVAHGVFTQKPLPGHRRARAAIAWSFGAAAVAGVVGLAVGWSATLALVAAIVGYGVAARRLRGRWETGAVAAGA